MKIKNSSSPFSNGAEATEPLDPRELRGGAAKAERFAAALSNLAAQTASSATGAPSAARAALSQIAGNADLSSSDGALKAVKESARFMIESRIDTDRRDSDEARQAVDDLTEFVATDPHLRSQLLSILQRVRPA